MITITVIIVLFIKNRLMLIILICLKKLRQILQLLSLKLIIESELQVNIIFSEDYIKNWSKEIFVIDSVFKTFHCTYKIKDLNGEKIIGSFYEKVMKKSCC